MQAIILVGGFGTRLRTVVSDVPKVLAPIGDRPFLAYLLDYLKTQGVTHVILAAHYLHEKIQAYFQYLYNGLSISYVIEDIPLGTGGAIKNALSLVDKNNPVFVLNGDTFVKLNYTAMLQAHNGQITMCICSVPNIRRYGSVVINDNYVTAFNEKEEPKPGWINAGVYLLNPDIFKDWSQSVFSFEKDFLSVNVSLLKPRAFTVNDLFIDIGIPEDYYRLQDIMRA